VSNDASRPDHLPDFRNPPLNEVVLGVQFSTPKGYQQIYAGEVWNLFRAEFPKIEEQLPLAPAFETFGLPSKGKQLGFITGASHDRFWFLSQDGDELIQFQQDRLLHNWRKVGDLSNEYPRFESMIKRFHGELDQLQGYLNGLVVQKLSINQCEISYINHIAPAAGQDIKASDWLRIVKFGDKEPDDFSTSFREVIFDEGGKPQGRLTCEASTGIKPDGSRIIVMTLTVRGAPKGSDIESALQFLTKGRELIVCRFAELTTEEAHKTWGRIR
jgi:uncharacterized protein (TIGR04255 family)